MKTEAIKDDVLAKATELTRKIIKSQGSAEITDESKTSKNLNLKRKIDIVSPAQKPIRLAQNHHEGKKLKIKIFANSTPSMAEKAAEKI